LIKKKATRKRVVIEMHMPKPYIIEHEIAMYYCKKCGKQVSATVPNALPKMKYDIHTVILISYLNKILNLPLERIEEVLWDIFEINISKGTVANILKRCEDFFESEEKDLK
jgi:transposase